MLHSRAQGQCECAAAHLFAHPHSPEPSCSLPACHDSWGRRQQPGQQPAEPGGGHWQRPGALLLLAQLARGRAHALRLMNRVCFNRGRALHQRQPAVAWMQATGISCSTPAAGTDWPFQCPVRRMHHDLCAGKRGSGSDHHQERGVGARGWMGWWWMGGWVLASPCRE